MAEPSTLRTPADMPADAESIREVKLAITASDAAYRTNRILLQGALAAAGVEVDESDQTLVDGIARYEPDLVQGLISWIGRANPPEHRRAGERHALALIAERAELAAAEPRNHHLALGIILALANGALR